MSIAHGGHTADEGNVCVMEALSVITGQRFTDHPVCVSQVIVENMISINDSIEDDKTRNKLKKVIPDIMGTAPVVIGEGKSDGFADNATGDWISPGTYEIEMTEKGNLDYIAAEEKREKLLANFLKKHDSYHAKYAEKYGYDPEDDIYHGDESLEDIDVPLSKKLNLIKEMAAIKHFN